jgi:ubiquinone/menaquinone biosynthesis C-methylase UbiE
LGEEEAIEIALAEVSKDNKQEVLDVGCGLGGTASYIQQHGWGKVTGTDIDSEAIAYAKIKYPQVVFHTCDVVNLPLLFTLRFDMLYIFSSFYAFNEKKLALESMRKVSKKGCRLIMFESVDHSMDEDFHQEVKDNYPLVFPIIEQMLAETGWEFSKFKNLDKEYCQWYKDLIQKIIHKKDEVIKLYSEETFDYAIKTYTTLLKYAEKGAHGGGVLYANAK